MSSVEWTGRGLRERWEVSSERGDGSAASDQRTLGQSLPSLRTDPSTVDSQTLPHVTRSIDRPPPLTPLPLLTTPPPLHPLQESLTWGVLLALPSFFPQTCLAMFHSSPMLAHVLVLCVLLLSLCSFSSSAPLLVNISNVASHLDTDGRIMDIHDGNTVLHEGTYYYYGGQLLHLPPYPLLQCLIHSSKDCTNPPRFCVQPRMEAAKSSLVITVASTRRINQYHPLTLLIHEAYREAEDRPSC